MTNYEHNSIFVQMPELAYVKPNETGARRIYRSIHCHPDMAEILFVYSGTGTYMCDGYKCPLFPGDFAFFNQGSMHTVESSSEMEIGTFCFGITGLQLSGYPAGYLAYPQAGFVRPVGENFQDIYGICRVIYQLTALQDPYSRAARNHLFLGLLLTALRCPADERMYLQTRESILATRIQSYIALHYREPLSLQSIGDALHISPSYLSRVFKQKFNMSPINFMIDCRIGEAQNLLVSSDYSAIHIGSIVGYDSINHFNAIFKKRVGMPPIEYRKNYLTKMHGKRIH